MKTLSKKELSIIYKKYISTLKENNISTRRYEDILNGDNISINNISIKYDWLCFEENGSCIPYIVIHNDYYEYIIKERECVIFEKKCYSENELFYEILENNFERHSREEYVSKGYKMFSLLDFEWANKFYLSLDDEDKKYISFSDK
ncbi:MAG: hypothetical protein IKH45_00090 [Neisseriaceae bacterium]|nr:hypothetical protein [Neisseriaceae bacterium]